MRQLTQAELRAIAGGHDPNYEPNDIKIPRVIIEGQRQRSQFDNMIWNMLMVRYDYTVPDNTPDHPDTCFLANNDPALKAVPANNDLRDIRQTAMMAHDYIKAQDPSKEWGALIISDANGNLRLGDVSSGTADSVNMTANLAAGERVVATVHSHPSTPGFDQSLPSTIATNGSGPSDERSTLNGIAAGYMDPNVLVYIIDNASGQMHEYDPRNISAQNRNNITNDYQQYGLDCSY